MKFFFGGHGQNGCGQSSYRTLKLTVSQKWFEWTDFLHDVRNSGKLKVKCLGGCGQKWACPFNSWDPKIYCVLEMSLLCLLTVMQYFLFRLTLCSISLTFKCQSTRVVLVGTLAVARRVLWNRVCPFCCLFGYFLELNH